MSDPEGAHGEYILLAKTGGEWYNIKNCQKGSLP